MVGLGDAAFLSVRVVARRCQNAGSVLVAWAVVRGLAGLAHAVEGSCWGTYRFPETAIARIQPGSYAASWSVGTALVRLPTSRLAPPRARAYAMDSIGELGSALGGRGSAVFGLRCSMMPLRSRVRLG